MSAKELLQLPPELVATIKDYLISECIVYVDNDVIQFDNFKLALEFIKEKYATRSEFSKCIKIENKHFVIGIRMNYAISVFNWKTSSHTWVEYNAYWFESLYDNYNSTSIVDIRKTLCSLGFKMSESEHYFRSENPMSVQYVRT